MTKHQLIGSSLIENLVTLLLISFVSLSVFGFLLKAQVIVKSSDYATMATLLVQEYAEKMQNDRLRAISGAYDITSSSMLATLSDTERQNCYESSANSSCDLALTEAKEWWARVKDTLKSAEVVVTKHTTGNARNIWLLFTDVARNSVNNEQENNTSYNVAPNNMCSNLPSTLTLSNRFCIYQRVEL